MKNSTLTKSRSRSSAASLENVFADLKVSRKAVAAVGTVSGAIGLWAVACFVGGMVSSGGPLAFAKAWVSAVTGM